MTVASALVAGVLGVLGVVSASPAAAATSCTNPIFYANTGATDPNELLTYSSSGTQLSAVPLGTVPYGDIAISADSSKLYGATFVSADSQLQSLNPTTGAVLSTVPLSLDGAPAGGPNALSFTSDGQLLLGTNGGAKVYKVNPATGVGTVFATLPTGYTPAGDFLTLPDGDILAVTSNTTDPALSFILRLHPDGTSTVVGTTPGSYGAGLVDGAVYLAGIDGTIYRVPSIPTQSAPSTPIPATVLSSTGRPFFGASAIGDTGACTPTVSLTKSLNGTRVDPDDQFSVGIRGTSPTGPVLSSSADSTSTGSGSTITSGTGTTGVYAATVGASYYLTETAAGSTILDDYTATVTCADANEVQTGLPDDAPVPVSVVPLAGAAIQCTITNAPVPTPSLDITKTSDATADSRPGDVVTYTVKATNTGEGDYTTDDPAVVIDDLTGVVDDGVLDEDSIAADRGDAPSYVAPKLTWTGALPAGESVILTYEVRLEAGGDGQVHNVAFNPDCVPGDSGCVPVTPPTCADADRPCDQTDFTLPRLSIVKSADKTDLPAVGGEVTYTVTVKNEGPGDYTADAPATFSDDLSDVLDDATLDPADVDASVGAATFDDPKLSWTGVLAAGDSATITYTVAYNGDGDKVLNNLACIPADEALDPGRDCATVRIPGSGLRQTKTVDPASGTTVDPGQDVTYTLSFENIGSAAADVDTTDDLAGVVDDAELTDGPDADAGLTATVNGAGDLITIGGSVPAGETLTVTYTVRVNAFADQNDHVLGNVLACEPGDGADCDPITTENPIAHLAVVKTSTANAFSRPGDVVTYTVKATNDGGADYTAADPAVVLDDLTGVLDDGTLDTGSIETDRIPDPTYTAPRINWAGALPAGDSVTVTYQVELKAGGDGDVRNVAFVPGCVPGAADCTTPPTPACADNIDPETGLPCDVTEFKLPRLSVTKSSDKATVSSVGDKVKYTITVANEGPGDYTTADPGTFEDDLSEVLDDATLVQADIGATAGAASLDGTTLSWSGELASGDSAVVTYTVTYTGAGDKTMTNVACVPATEAVDPATPCDTVTVAGPGLVQTKTVDPETGTAVDVGQEVEYTLTFKNMGNAPATVDTSDDLTGVVDDAEMVDGPDVEAPLTATLNGAGDRITIGGTVGVGRTLTVTYTVKVLPFADQADHVLGNVLACQAGSGPDCDPATTENPVKSLDIEKTSNATADSRPGDVITYTVKATNTGEGDYTTADPAVVVDDLTGVLDDGTIDEGSLAADRGDDPTYAEPRIAWAGALPAGESVTVTYEVKLKAGGDGNVRNVAFGPDCAPGEAGCNPPTPAGCTDNVDPATGLPCDVATFPLPKLTISKAADKTALPAVGETVEYTVTISNEGPGDYTADAPATFEDDLAAVLDDATLDDADINASVGTASLAGTKLSWTGVLAAGQSATVTYAVAYTGAGNHQLKNLACIPVGEAQDPTDPCRTVTIPGSGLLQTKTVDPASGTAVDPGRDVTYTLSFENIGGTAAAVDTSDDLTGVVDDADLSDGPDAETGLNAVLNGAGDKILITGSVPVGETLTVTYTVKVKAFGDQADHLLKNALACQPNDPADCEPQITQNPIRHLRLTKVSDATQDVNTGDKVTYTLAVANDGEADYTALDPGTFTDDLTGVLDDATYNGDVSATAGAVDYDEPTLTWTGSLAKGDSATITYTVTVTNAGDHELRNTAQVTGCTDTGCNPPPVVTPLPHIVPAKTSDPESSTAVKGGQVVKYTLAWTNDGKTTGPVDSTDDLSMVLDDGDVTSEPVSDGDGVTATRTGDKIRIIGALAAGDTVKVTYEVTMKADGERGDDFARNVLTPDLPVVTCDDDGDCTEVPPPTTENPLGELEDWKSVDPASGSTVQPGTKVTYTLHFTNTGKAPVEVNRDDVLTGVLDDAELVTEPKASGDALDVSKVTDGRFTVSGTLEVGETVTVAYGVRVKADGDRGDDQLGNFLVDAGDKPPAECTPADDQRADCTVNPVSNVTVTKSSDPKSGTKVKAGQSISYALTFTNVSKNPKAGPVHVDYTDHMAGLLDDADITADARASDPALTATRARDKIRVVGSLAPGQVVTVKYTVTVRAYDEQGDHALENVVAVTGQPPLCAPNTQLCTLHEAAGGPPVEPQGRDLPRTGASVGGGFIALALLFLLAGGGLVLAVRRRRHDDGEGDGRRSAS